ncbi:transposase [Komagataeibacter saccharivorans]|uniref:transposase n=1 Tax=Komagataeibacter saccharivorans TaxID=265959 RepID=UPI0038D13F98
MPEKKRLGRPRRTDLRRVMEAILYIVTAGCQWRQLPGTFRPSQPYRAISTVGSAREDGKP